MSDTKDAPRGRDIEMGMQAARNNSDLGMEAFNKQVYWQLFSIRLHSPICILEFNVSFIMRWFMLVSYNYIPMH